MGRMAARSLVSRGPDRRIRNAGAAGNAIAAVFCGACAACALVAACELAEAYPRGSADACRNAATARAVGGAELAGRGRSAISGAALHPIARGICAARFLLLDEHVALALPRRLPRSVEAR